MMTTQDSAKGDDAVAMIIEHFLQMSRWAGYLGPLHRAKLASGLRTLASEIEEYDD